MGTILNMPWGIKSKEDVLKIFEVKPISIKLTWAKLGMAINVLAVIMGLVTTSAVVLMFKNPQVLGAIFEEIEVSSPIANDAFLKEMGEMELRIVEIVEQRDSEVLASLSQLQGWHYAEFISDLNVQYGKLRDDPSDVKELVLKRAVINYSYLPDSLKTPDLVLVYNVVLEAYKDYTLL